MSKRAERGNISAHGEAEASNQHEEKARQQISKSGLRNDAYRYPGDSSGGSPWGCPSGPSGEDPPKGNSAQELQLQSVSGAAIKLEDGTAKHVAKRALQSTNNLANPRQLPDHLRHASQI